MKVTKQSLNRVLKDLINLKAIKYEKDQIDTRIKHVFLTEEGEKLFNEIFSAQKKRIYQANSYLLLFVFVQHNLNYLKRQKTSTIYN